MRQEGIPTSHCAFLLDDDVIILDMEDTEKMIGAMARLPDGELVKIEHVYKDGCARVRRIEGEFAGMIVLCHIEKLELVKAASG